MSRSPDDAEFWLPSQFLADDDVVFMDKENFQFKNAGTKTTGTATSLRADMGFPTEFPYEFDSFGSNSSALSSPVESVVSATETESSDEEDFFAGFTRRFAQSTLRESSTQKLKPEWVLAGSPQSTLSGIGSWSCRSGTMSSNGSPNGPSQVASPPTTPFGAKNDTWDLIFAAAGQVARLKMNGQDPRLTSHHTHHDGTRGLLTSPVRNPNDGSFGFFSNQSLNQNLTPFQAVKRDMAVKPQQCGSAWGRQQVKAGWPQVQFQQQQSHYQQQQIQNRGGRGCGYENGRCGGRPLNLPQSAWPPLQVHNQNQQTHTNGRATAMGGALLGGSGAKRECAGTGVFLPRRYTNPPEPRKKSGCPNVVLPAKVVQALNLSFEDLSNGHSQPRFGCGFAPDHESLIARRNALLEQQRRSLIIRPEAAINHEIRLPQEWTY